MTKSAVIVGFVLLAGTSVATHGQGRDTALVEPGHPGTALLDSMGIFAGAEVPVVEFLHPGTALLDSMGIYAGAPAPAPRVAGNDCQVRHLPQHGG